MQEPGKGSQEHSKRALDDLQNISSTAINGEHRKKSKEDNSQSTGTEEKTIAQEKTEKTEKTENTDNTDNTLSFDIPFAELNLLEKVQVGNASMIYKGEWRGQTVAVKKYFTYEVSKLQDQADKVFKYERELMEMLAKHPHPNIIKYFGACTVAPDICLVLEYIPKSVYEMIMNPFIKELDWALRIRIVSDIISGLSHLHNLPTPITHNDLKTDNLLCDEKGTVRIIDFGQSSLTTVVKRAETLCFGNPAWTAPECLAGEPFSTKSDIYAFGIIMWEVLTRQDPFPGVNEDEMLELVSKGERPPIPEEAPTSWVELMTRCWATKPEDRPSAREAQHALLQLSQQSDVFDVPEAHIASDVNTTFPIK